MNTIRRNCSTCTCPALLSSSAATARSRPPAGSAGDADGHVQSWSECFPGVRQKPVIILEDSTEWLGTLYPGRRYPHQWSVIGV